MPLPSSLPDGLGSHIPAIEQVIDHALALPADVDLADLPPADRIFVVPVDSEMALLVVELTGQHPLDRRTFERLTERGRFQSMLVTRELADLGAMGLQVFDLETLRARHHFQVKRRTQEPAPDDAQTPTGDSQAAAEGS